MHKNFCLQKAVSDFENLVAIKFFFVVTEDPGSICAFLYLRFLRIDILVAFHLSYEVLILPDIVVLFYSLRFIQFTISVFKDPFVINMVNSRLVSANAFVRSDLDVTIKVSANQDRCVVGTEFDGLRSSRASNEL